MSDKIEWIPILVDLGEAEVARILDKSPDAKTAIMEARENFKKAEEEGEALRRKGHEGET